MLRDQGLSDNVRTVDSWQGREKEIMIFSAVRCNHRGSIGFLENERRTNVALTRAMHGMIIVGNARTLASDPKWKLLLEVFKITMTLVKGLDDAINRIEQNSKPDSKAMED